ncbi:MAG: hypothetical protein ACJ8EE_10135 [Bradyrhizobium sp.]
MSAAPMAATLIARPNKLEPNSFIVIFPLKSTFFGKTRLEDLVCLQHVGFKRHAAPAIAAARTALSPSGIKNASDIAALRQ